MDSGLSLCGTRCFSKFKRSRVEGTRKRDSYNCLLDRELSLRCSEHWKRTGFNKSDRDKTKTSSIIWVRGKIWLCIDGCWDAYYWIKGNVRLGKGKDLPSCPNVINVWGTMFCKEINRDWARMLCWQGTKQDCSLKWLLVCRSNFSGNKIDVSKDYSTLNID